MEEASPVAPADDWVVRTAGKVRAEAEQLIATERSAISTQTEQARNTLQSEAQRIAAEISAQILHH